MRKPLDLTRYAPPGQALDYWRNTLLTGLVLAALYSAYCFGARCYWGYQKLFYVNAGEKFLLEGAKMPYFAELTLYIFRGFWLVALLMLCFGVYFYTSFWSGSKSIYLMRRLPSRWELPRRVVTLPLVSVTICLLTPLVLYFLYLGIYLLVTPKECLQPNQWEMIWSVMLCWN